MKLDMKTVLAANLHETKNLMTQLMLRLDAMVVIDAAVRDARFLCQQINDRMVQMLLLYEMQSEQLKPSIEAHHPADLLQELAGNIRAWSGERVSVEYEVDDNTPNDGYFDRALLEMALMNAVHNAFRHATSRIVLRTGLREHRLYFLVEDDGQGFPPAVLESAHDACMPVSHNGTGLGLYFAALIARLHVNRGQRGALELHNRTQGSGAQFIILLPE